MEISSLHCQDLPPAASALVTHPDTRAIAAARAGVVSWLSQCPTALVGPGKEVAAGFVLEYQGLSVPGGSKSQSCKSRWSLGKTHILHPKGLTPPHPQPFSPSSAPTCQVSLDI